jgi:hypothetical protein
VSDFGLAFDEEATQAAITYAANHPHLYIDPISGDE